MRSTTEQRSVPGRRYARAALGALLAGLACLVAFAVLTDSGAGTRATPLATRLGRFAALGAVIGLPLIATIVAASRHRYALVGRWFAVVLIGLLALFFIGVQWVFVPAFGFMLVAVVTGHGARDAAVQAPTDDRTTGFWLGAAITFVVVGVIAAGSVLSSNEEDLGYRCNIPPSDSIAAATGVRPDDVQEFSGGGEFSATAISDGRTIVFVTCDPTPPTPLDQIRDEIADDPQRQAAGAVSFSVRRADDAELPIELSFVHDDALITIFVATLVDADQARRLVGGWLDASVR